MLEINNRTKKKIDEKGLRRITEAFLRAYRRPKAVVSLAFVGDARIATLNGRYRGVEKVTDVLSFPGEAPDLGEIIINLQEIGRIRKYTGLFLELGLKKAGPDYLLRFLLVHGLLHLVGYDDRTEESRREMLEKGRRFLVRFS